MNIIASVLVTGASGQLGTDLVIILKLAGFQVYAKSKTELDITNENDVFSLVTLLKPEIIIHCAAYTNVDMAESQPDLAFLINVIGTRNIALAAESIQAKLVYISTDYVFDGISSTPYHEFSTVNPINVYGNSKLAGERTVRDFHSKFFIVRTSWVFGWNGKNFVKTMLKLATEKEQLMVVHDQVGCPTYTIDLCKCIVQLIQTKKYGVYHISNTGSCSWYEFASELFNQANVSCKLLPCNSEEFPRKAKRPKYSVLDHMGLRMNGFQSMPDWKDALERFLHK
ncbi:dTDP-4-dehydrorhamnose reductase [Pseudoneobacillus sp. C159]